MHRLSKVLLVIVALAVIGRLSLPAIVKHFVNQTLEHLDAYRGEVTGVGLHLLGGAVTFKGLTLVSRESKAPQPLLTAEAVDVAFLWRPLFKRVFVGDIMVRRPVVHYVKPLKGQPGKPAPTAAAAAGPAGGSKTAAFVRRFEIVDGRVEFEDDDVKPGFTVSLHDIRLVGHDIESAPGVVESATATVTIAGQAMQQGDFAGELAADLWAKRPTFKYKLRLAHFALPQINEVLKKYLGVEMSDGIFEFDSEGQAVDGQIKGYVKPLITGLDAVKVPGSESLGRKIKGEVVKLASKVLKNHRKDLIGTQVPFTGSVDNPKVKFWPAFAGLVSNAFIQAISPGLEGLVDFKSPAIGWGRQNK